MEKQITRCPKCQTSFWVTEAQLHMANGAVRCGSCLHIFNAPDHLVSKQKIKPKGDGELVREDQIDRLKDKSVRHPKVFLSYSHDSPEHSQWVTELASEMKKYGVDVILDAWHLRLGESVTRFMEKNIEECDFTVCICTNEYIDKTNNIHGGAGYEGQILSAIRLNNCTENNIIPIVRNVSKEEQLPSFLSSSLYLDLSDGVDYDSQVRRLVGDIHGKPVNQPPELGDKDWRR